MLIPKNNSNQEASNQKKEINEKKMRKKDLQDSYMQILEQYRHNDKLGNDLASTVALINSGLVSVIALILSSSLSILYRFYLVSAFCWFGGFAANLALLLIKSRNKVYLYVGMMKGRYLEEELRKHHNIDFELFRTQEMIQNKKQFEYFEDNTKKSYSLKSWEKFGVHTWMTRLQVIVTIVWLILPLILWFIIFNLQLIVS